MWIITIIILIVITASSVVALFLRGFRIQDFTEQLKSKSLTTPAVEVWLIKTPNYPDKLDAYKTGINAARNGFGVYVLPENSNWTWVASACRTENEAREIFSTSGLSDESIIQPYQIQSKKISIEKDAYESCSQILTAVQAVIDLLFNLRTTLAVKIDLNNLKIELTSHYNQIRTNTESLQKLNTNLHSEVIATIIYTANQNILSLQAIIGLNQSDKNALATINTALLNTIFSLDNF